ncbi:hypothetical protein GLX30_23040 [Streptomyces sp. Tu 2975]|uniref:hypothetical protein n=1 Tax=Streptomyces sp. Tu 2975 TaxID=2676871 RepID=UPI00135794CC|nr:hypothetical protein [Streptomyces sp. Tu 2975]QIP86422.1 hypothetical protein GLX30_23040 [Streptomyces sp. Tu 2975]
MSEALQQKILLAKEKKEKERILQSLPNGVVEEFLLPGEVPEWVAARFAQFTSTATPPHYSITTDSRGELSSWIESLARKHDVSNPMLVSTGLRNFPWVKCQCTSPGWAEVLISALGRDLSLLSSNMRRLLVVFEEEYECIAFTATE